MNENILNLYLKGLSIPLVAKEVGLSRSTVRLFLKNAKVLRTRTEGVRLSAKEGRLGGGLRGKKRPPFSQEHRDKMSKAKLGKGTGFSIKKNGYIQITAGENIHRSAHVVIMEELIGRRLKSGECIHHIDGNPSNNNLNNLAFMTTAAHGRLHRLQDKMLNKKRTRDKNGRFKNDWD